MIEEENPEQEEQQEDLYEHHRIEVDRGQELLRIDKFLFNRLPNTSRNRIQLAAEAGSILVNQKPAKSSYKVKPGDIISIVLAHPPREIELIPENIPLNIVYEDEHLAVVNKAAGMVVHPAYGNYKGTLVNALLYHFQNEKRNSKNEKGKPETSNSELQTDLRPGLVHRIDKNTTGLMVIAKDEHSMTHLANQFFNRTIKRSYLALVWGDFEEDDGTVNVHIGRCLKDRKIMDTFPDGSYGKIAITHYKVEEHFGYVTLVRCKLETGRTHQIRVHMKYIRHPLFNDESYGGNKILKGTTFTKYRQFVENCFELMPHHALHAQSLGFIHPHTGKEMFFESALPENFQQLLLKWRNYTVR